MDNKVTSRIKRGLKVTSSYFMSIIVFGVFSFMVLSLAKDNTPVVMPYFSLLIFLLLFFSVYTEMRVIAFKEKRPQYNINPSPFKGLLYGFIGIVPIAVLQSVILLINVPEDFQDLKRRIYQGLTGSLYWFAKLLGNAPAHYILSLSLVVLIAGLGYYAGHKDFLASEFIRRKLGIKKVKKKK